MAWVLSMVVLTVGVGPAHVLPGHHQQVMASPQADGSRPAVPLADGKPTSAEIFLSAIAFDPAKDVLYVTNATTPGTVTRVSDSTYQVGTPTAVGYLPEDLAYDGEDGKVFVTNLISDDVSVLNDTTSQVVDTIPVPAEPWGIAYDQGRDEVFVATLGGNVTVISGASDAAEATFPVGSEPAGVAYDSAHGEIFVTDLNSSNVSVLNDTNLSVVATIDIGYSGANSIVYDPLLDEMIVTGAGENLVSIINDSTDRVVLTVSLGTNVLAGGLACDTALGRVYVANSNAASVSVFSASTGALVASVPTGQMPGPIAVDPHAGTVWVGNQGSGNLSVFSVEDNRVLRSVNLSVISGSPPPASSSSGGGGGTGLWLDAAVIGAVGVAAGLGAWVAVSRRSRTRAPLGSIPIPPSLPLTTTRRLAAIMFTDMVGFTKLAQIDEGRALELLDAHRTLLRSVFPRYHGTEVKTLGDGFLVEFGSTLDASQCGIAIQTALQRRNAMVPPTWRLMVRISIHVGDVVHDRGDILGDAVNIAARILPLAVPGGICVTQEVYEQVRNRLRFPFAQVDTRNMKATAFPVGVYQIVLQEPQSTLLRGEVPPRRPNPPT